MMAERENRVNAQKKWMRKICRDTGRATHELGGAGEGYGIVPAVVDKAVVGDLLERLTESDLPRSRAGVRHMLRDRWVAEIAAGQEMDCTRYFRR